MSKKKKTNNQSETKATPDIPVNAEDTANESTKDTEKTTDNDITDMDKTETIKKTAVKEESADTANDHVKDPASSDAQDNKNAAEKADGEKDVKGIEKADDSEKTSTEDEEPQLSAKSKLTLYIVEGLIAIAAIVFIIISVVQGNKDDSTSANGISSDNISGNILDSASEDAAYDYVTIDNSVLYEVTPAMTDVSTLNTLTLEECDAAVAEGTMMKLTTSDGIDVYVNNYLDQEAFAQATAYTQEEVDDYIFTDLLYYYGEESEPEHEEAQLGDTVSIDYVGKINDVTFEGGTGSTNLLLGSGTFIPGFEDGCVGMKAGEVRDINVTFPEDYVATEYAGKDAVFTVTLHEIVSTTTYPELTDEIVQSAFTDITTVAEAEEYYENLLVQEKIWTFIAKDFYVSALPEETVNSYYNMTLEYYDIVSQSYQTSIEDLLGMYGETIDQFREEVMASSCESSRYSAMYQAISQTHDLTVTNEDIAELATSYGYEDIESFMQESGEQNVMDYLYQKEILEYLTTLR
ncbi:MAG: FKBP-type peptidyl-prolyl cis-trans isomerase [Lachnospiraceae bacterium]